MTLTTVNFSKNVIRIKKLVKKDRLTPKSTTPINGHLMTILKPNNIFFQLSSLRLYSKLDNQR